MVGFAERSVLVFWELNGQVGKVEIQCGCSWTPHQISSLLKPTVLSVLIQTNVVFACLLFTLQLLLRGFLQNKLVSSQGCKYISFHLSHTNTYTESAERSPSLGCSFYLGRWSFRESRYTVQADSEFTLQPRLVSNLQQSFSTTPG